MAHIIYEDNQIIVAYKKEGVLSQEDISKAPDILKNYLLILKIPQN